MPFEVHSSPRLAIRDGLLLAGPAAGAYALVYVWLGVALAGPAALGVMLAAALGLLLRAHRRAQAARVTPAVPGSEGPTTPFMLWVTDPQLRLTALHSTDLRPAPAEAALHLGRPLADIFDADEAHPLLAAHRQALAGQSASLHQTMRDRLFDLRVEPLRDAHGRTLGCVCLAVDVTEEQPAQAALRRREARWHALMEQLPVGVYRSTRDGRLLEANPALAELLGCDSVEQLLERPLPAFYLDAGDRERHLGAVDREGTQTAEFAVRRADGRRVWLQDHARRSPAGIDADGCYDGVVVDVTERKRFEQHVASVTDFYESILNELPIQVAALDAQGRYRYLNPASVSDPEMRAWMLGKTSVDYAARRGLDPEPFAQRHRWIREVVRTRRQSAIEETLITRDGEQRHILRVAAPVTGPDGAVVLVVGYSIDRTEQQRYEAQLLEARDRAEEMGRLKSTFIANISHEIRTPLTGIIGFATVLQDEVAPAQRELITLMKHSGERLLETLNSILDYAKLEANALEVALDRLDLAEEVEDTLVLFRPMAQRQGLAFDVDVPEEPVPVRLDRTLLHRVLTNLLSNALKFTEEGAVRVVVRSDGAHVRLSVTDTGIGIDPDFLPYLFDEFKQESSGLDRTHQGSGLGLAITKRLVESMHGQIAVTSRKGEGTTFEVTFPVMAEVQQEAA